MNIQKTPVPKVSAIMIFLNGERFIAEAIDSVLGQTLADWELILVDDGTTDGATAIAKSYAARYPERIRYTEHPGHVNRGMSASRNAGLRLARGENVAFLDADDIWLPRRLEAHVALLDRHPEVALITGRTLWWRSWMTDPGPRWPWERTDTPSFGGLPLHQVIEPPAVAISFLERRGATLPGICSLTARREAVLAVGGFNDSFRTLYEDQVFLFRMCLRHRVWATDEVLDCYRQHPDSTCHQEGQLAGDARARPIFLAWLQAHLVDSGCKDERLWRAFRAEMLRFDQPRLWWWSRLPLRARDWINVQRQRLLILLLTPEGYNGLRRRFGLSYAETVSPPQSPRRPPDPLSTVAGLSDPGQQ